MAKKGDFYPWRVKFSYPNDINGIEHRINYEDHALRKAAELLYRGADIEILTVNPDTKAHTLKYAARAADFDFSSLGEDPYEANAHELAYDMLYEHLFGKPSPDAMIRAEHADKEEAEAREGVRQLPDWMKRPGGKPDNRDLAVKTGQEALTEATGKMSFAELSQKLVPDHGATLKDKTWERFGTFRTCGSLSEITAAAEGLPEQLPEPEETERVRLALNEEIAVEHEAVAQALSDKGLLRHARISDLPGWPCPTCVRDIPGQKNSWGWVYLTETGGVFYDVETGRLWADGNAAPTVALIGNAKALLAWTEEGLGLYIGSASYLHLRTKSKLDMDADEPGRWIPIAKVLPEAPDNVKNFG